VQYIVQHLPFCYFLIPVLSYSAIQRSIGRDQLLYICSRNFFFSRFRIRISPGRNRRILIKRLIPKELVKTEIVSRSCSSISIESSYRTIFVAMLYIYFNLSFSYYFVRIHGTTSVKALKGFLQQIKTGQKLRSHLVFMELMKIKDKRFNLMQ
jgi:hypothetical protein